LRLAVISPFVDRRHGTERALAELLERLVGRYGCEVHLYAQRVEDLQLADSRSARPPKEAGAIFWHKVPSVPGPHVAQFIGWMFLNGFLRRWHTTFRGGSYDLVLSPGINCLHPDLVIVHALFHRLNELSREENELPGARSGFFRSMHRRVYYRLLTALEGRIYTDPKVALAAVSNRTAALLKQYFHREDVRVVQNGVDTAHFSVAARVARRSEARRQKHFHNEDFVLLLIGNDWRVKGLPTILEAMGELSVLPVRLLVVGNDTAAPFRARATQLGVQNRCHWELPQADVLDFYAAADLYVSPSREDSFGLPVAEAMACGLPVITSSSAGVADHIEDGVDGFVLREPRDAQRLALLIKRLYAYPDLRRDLGEAAARKIVDCNWDRHAAFVWELLKDLTAKKSHSLDHP
jgi:glycosyltransferase involved in cell wall biosynthesis